MLNVNLMVGIAATTTHLDGINTAQFVNVSQIPQLALQLNQLQQPQLHLQHQYKVVVLPNGLVMDIVMMKTIMLVVNLIREIAATVHNLIGTTGALFVNAS